ncbi:MAG TPA: hypothetical protein VJT13_22175 [Xanthobacteraceae bacterium]|nr:hypothetical protein [Xanthobacteraceae bacterium]
MASAFELIADQLADPEAQWSLGTFGAIAEFMRDAGEPAQLVREDPTAAVVTPRGGIRLQALPGLKPVAFETVTTQSWSQRVAFCLPQRESAMSRRTVLTELGPDAQALRGEDRAAVLFDLGLGALQVDCCIRTADAALAKGLRAHAGRSLFEQGNPAMGLILQQSPHRVFVTRAGRAEVFQAIPGLDGKAPEGPHTHVLPKLLAHGRTHAATEPIPKGWVSCAHLYPAHPLRDGNGRAHPFDARRYGAFQRLLARHGDSEHVQLKRNVTKALNAGAGPEAIAMPTDRFAQAAVRIALRQLKASSGPSPNLTVWFAAHDRGSDADEAEPTEH